MTVLAFLAPDNINATPVSATSPLPVTLDVGTAPITAKSPLPVNTGGTTYATVAASQTAQGLGATGAIGDYLGGLLVTPATTGAGSISILDNAISITVFVTGTLSDLKPFFIPLGIKSVSGQWKVTTGANVSVVAVGSFT